LRKDRVAELKTEKAKLDHLAQEKAHADKLKSRISDLTATIAAKEIEYEETRKLYDELVEKNAKFYDWASKFRDLYRKVEGLQEKEKQLISDLAEAKENVQEIEGSFHSWAMIKC
jgi:DNA repair protein RAD50